MVEVLVAEGFCLLSVPWGRVSEKEAWEPKWKRWVSGPPEGRLPGEDWPKKACYKCRGVSE